MSKHNVNVTLIPNINTEAVFAGKGEVMDADIAAAIPGLKEMGLRLLSEVVDEIVKRCLEGEHMSAAVVEEFQRQGKPVKQYILCPNPYLEIVLDGHSFFLNLREFSRTFGGSFEGEFKRRLYLYGSRLPVITSEDCEDGQIPLLKKRSRELGSEEYEQARLSFEAMLARARKRSLT